MKTNITTQMKNILNDYTDDVVRAVTETLSEVGEEAAKELKSTSPKRKGGGKYAKGWVSQTEAGRTHAEVTVGNKKYYRLTHLLENGHALRRGGRTTGRAEARPHIGAVNESAQERAIEKIKEAIKDIR